MSLILVMVFIWLLSLEWRNHHVLNVLEKGIGGEDAEFSSRIGGESGCGHRVVDVVREMNCGIVVVLSSIVWYPWKKWTQGLDAILKALIPLVALLIEIGAWIESFGWELWDGRWDLGYLWKNLDNNGGILIFLD
jgi:hypothetical protein